MRYRICLHTTSHPSSIVSIWRPWRQNLPVCWLKRTQWTILVIYLYHDIHDNIHDYITFTLYRTMMFLPHLQQSLGWRDSTSNMAASCYKNIFIYTFKFRFRIIFPTLLLKKPMCLSPSLFISLSLSLSLSGECSLMIDPQPRQRMKSWPQRSPKGHHHHQRTQRLWRAWQLSRKSVEMRRLCGLGFGIFMDWPIMHKSFNQKFKQYIYLYIKGQPSHYLSGFPSFPQALGHQFINLNGIQIAYSQNLYPYLQTLSLPRKLPLLVRPAPPLRMWIVMGLGWVWADPMKLSSLLQTCFIFWGSSRPGQLWFVQRWESHCFVSSGGLIPTSPLWATACWHM